MKVFLRVVLNHLEKIIFAFMLLLLIVILVLQVQRYVDTMRRIKEIRDVDVTAGRKIKLPPLDESVFNCRVAADQALLWQPVPSLGTWAELAKQGHPNIYKPFMNRPPATITNKRYVTYLQERGPGSLFDPQLYVYPRDGKPNLLAFETVRAFYPPYPNDAPPRPSKVDFPDLCPKCGKLPCECAEPPAPREEALGEWARLASPFRAVLPDLPFVLSTVMDPDPKDKKTWTVTLKVGGKSEFVRLGKRIPGTDYMVEDASVELGEGPGGTRAKVFRAVVVREGTDVRATIEKDKVTPDPAGEPYYNVIFYGLPATIARPWKMKNGDLRPLSYKGRMEELYKLVADGDQIGLVRIKDDREDGNPIPLGKYDADDYAKWNKAHPAVKPAPPTPLTPVPGAPVMPTPPPGGPGMPMPPYPMGAGAPGSRTP